jgi:hypothetical protein
MPAPRDPDDPRDDGEEGRGDATPLIVSILAIIAGIFIVLSIVAVFTPRDTTTPATASCTESCWGFIKLECPTNRIMSACFGFPGCGGTPHVCGQDK